MSQRVCYVVRDLALGIFQGRGRHGAVRWSYMWETVREGTMPLALLSTGFQSLFQLPTSKLGPSGADSQVGEFVYVLGPCDSLQ